MKAFPAASVVLAILAWPAAAQDLTDEQMAERFRMQLETFRAARENSLGATRGLVLTPVRPAAEVAPGATVTATSPAAGGETPSAAAATPGGGEAELALSNYTLPEDQQVNVQVQFAFDSAALDETARTALRRVCGILDGAGINVLRIVGHTDATGNAPYNQRLSVLRAEEVGRFFVNDCGIDAGRLQTVGVGEQFPFDATDPMAGENRRVEFQAMS